jgi:hypothetical protein
VNGIDGAWVDYHMKRRAPKAIFEGRKALPFTGDPFHRRRLVRLAERCAQAD